MHYLNKLMQQENQSQQKNIDRSNIGIYAVTDLLAQEVLERTHDNKLQRRQEQP